MSNLNKFILVFILSFITTIHSFANTAVFARGSKDNKVIALTFDDGPNNTSLPKILELLKEKNIKSSFFFLGKNIIPMKEIVKKTFDDGHLVLNHSYNHPNFTNLSEEVTETEIVQTNLAIKEVLGVTPNLYRPPFGIVTENQLKTGQKFNMNIILWNADGQDWNKKLSNKEILTTLKKQVKNGSIILMHTHLNNNKSYEILKEFIPFCISEGYTFVTLDKLLNIKAYNEN